MCHYKYYVIYWSSQNVHIEIYTLDKDTNTGQTCPLVRVDASRLDWSQIPCPDGGSMQKQIDWLSAAGLLGLGL
jgi:hypothetical protein